MSWLRCWTSESVIQQKDEWAQDSVMSYGLSDGDNII